MLTPERDTASIKLTTRLAVVNSNILVLEAQRVSHGSVNGEVSESWAGRALLAQFTQERKELEAEIAQRG